MNLPMGLDETIWEISSDFAGNVREAATQALERIGWKMEIQSTCVARHREPDSLADRRCVEIWCVKLAETEPEIRHCLSAIGADPFAKIVDRFASTFAALRTALETGHPLTRKHEGMRAANDALDEFNQLHAGHKLGVVWAGDEIVTHCADCREAFREHYEPVGSDS